MKKPAVKVYCTSVLNAYRTRVNVAVAAGSRSGGENNISSSSSPQITPTKTTDSLDLVGPPQLITKSIASPQIATKISSSYGNPCLDLFFHTRHTKPLLDPRAPEYSHEYLKHLLPLAWSSSPLTTLKLICNLRDGSLGLTGKGDEEGFFTAAYWLYQNHPKTLASNIVPIAGSFGTLTDLLELLYRSLHGEDVRTRNNKSASQIYRDMKKPIGGRISSSRRRNKIFAMANNALQRYRLDRNYRLLHDGISDFFAYCLKFDIQTLNNYHDNDTDESKWLEMTLVSESFPELDSYYDRSTLICESIAKKMFPPDEEFDNEEAADYVCKVRERLRKEVLAPLKKISEKSGKGPNQWGYHYAGFKQEPCPVETYLEGVKAGGKSKIEADALLPNKIVRYTLNDRWKGDDGVFEEEAELQWKNMVEDKYLKQGRLKNCLAVFDICTPGSCVMGRWVSALAVLASELSEEPWKGKVMSFCFGCKPVLHSIQGDDLKSKCEFTRSLDCGKQEFDDNEFNDLEKVFDLILEVAVKGNLRAEQMIRKVFVFTKYKDFYGGNSKRCWESDYAAIESKFEEKGYGNVVPQIVFWNLDNRSNTPTCSGSSKQGNKVMLGGFNDNLVKSFLDNDGDIGPEHVMEATIAGKEYHSLVVVD